MKRLLSISIFVLASTLGFAQYNHVLMAPNGTMTEQGQYNADPGITANDSKQTIEQKMSMVHKIGIWKYWYDSGTKLAEEEYTNAGAPTGIWKSWHTNGQLASEVNHATGTAVYYHENGAKAEEGTVNANSERTGTWKGWHDNGKLNYTGSWTATGQKTGVWQYYDSNEQLTGTEHWNNGIMVN
jgi:antitoxin component YwqK of YwqJK toxin-antitoxin module